MSHLLFVPSIIFLAVVAPIWIVMHYRYKVKMVKGISPDEQLDIDEMLEAFDKLIDRVETLESILHDEQPEWETPTRDKPSRSKPSRNNRQE